MFYASVAMLSLIACCYLLFRRANAIAPDITPPVRLRRWTAAFFAAIALCHLWYLPTYFLTSPDDLMLGSLIAGLLDCMTVIPLTIVILLVMLQDRRRPLWPVGVIMTPLIAGLTWCVAIHSHSLLPVLYAYFLLMWFGLIIYMVRGIRQYGRWLRDNYADLEHKEVWQSFVVLAIMLLVYVIYSLDVGELVYEYVMEFILVVVICYLLWRVETLSDLRLPVNDAEEETGATEDVEDNDLPPSIRNNIELLLQQHCIDEQLYLQHDLNLLQLANLLEPTASISASISPVWARLTMPTSMICASITSSASIMRLSLPISPSRSQQLAHESGFRSYSTFSAAFKQSMGMTATEWMRNLARNFRIVKNTSQNHQNLLVIEL